MIDAVLFLCDVSGHNRQLCRRAADKRARDHHAKEKADGLPVALYLEAPPIDGPLRHGWPLQQSI